MFSLNFIGFWFYIFPITTHISITMGFSLTIWLGTIIYSLYNFKDKYLSIFFPHQAPLFLSFLLVFVEIASILSRPLSLGMRLASNLTAGHLILGIGGVLFIIF